MISSRDALGLVRFSEEENAILKSLEESVDREIAKSHISKTVAGAPVVISRLPPVVTSRIAHEAKRRYEKKGGWEVLVESNNDVVAMMFSHPSKAVEPERRAAPAVQLSTERAPLRLLVRMPTRSRPAQALDVLEKYRTMAGIPIQIEVVIDADDQTMLDARVLQRLNALDCTITVGTYGSKVAACNGGCVYDWDILLLASDDMVPVVDGYAVRIVEEFIKRWPHLDGALHLNDGYAGERLCTLPIMGRRLYERFGYVYHPRYKSLYCDNEQTEVFQKLGRIEYLNEKLIEHRHFVTGAPIDPLYRHNESFKNRDQEIYEERRAQNFYLDHRLTICIATIPTRAAQLARLLDELYSQWFNRDWDLLVDSGEGSIGAKRQRLLERARGKYVCFVDDDDFVSHDYVERILKALAADPDCVSLRGVMTKNGDESLPFEHSLKYTQWNFQNGLYERTPNHLNPVRRELALQAGFTDLEHAEDRAYSTALRPLLKTEADSGDAPLYYYWWIPQTTKRE